MKLHIDRTVVTGLAINDAADGKVYLEADLGGVTKVVGLALTSAEALHLGGLLIHGARQADGLGRAILLEQGKYGLGQCLRELKWGRPALAQQWLCAVADYLDDGGPLEALVRAVPLTTDN